MSQFYSQMSQFGDELEEDAIFGEFEAAWDAHSSSPVVSPLQKTYKHTLTTLKQHRNGSCRRYNMQEAY